jgi:hydrogenase maturation protease
MNRPRILVCGIGNPDRGDDGIGSLVVRQLAGRVSDVVVLSERGGDMLALIDAWSGHDTVILIDAAAARGAPGRIRWIDLRADSLVPELSLSSTHAFGVAEAIRLADALGMSPARLFACAIEGAGFDPGGALSPEVAAAVAPAADLIIAKLRDLETIHA